MNPATRQNRGLGAALWVLAFLGFGLNIWLLVLRYSNKNGLIAGCGGGGCDEVMASRWSVVFLVPVGVFGTLAYLALALSLIDRFRRLQAPALGALLGGAGWFIFLQVAVLGRFCPWCLAAHGVSIAVALPGCLRLAAWRGFAGAVIDLVFWTVLGALGLASAQVFGPVPPTHRIEDVSPPAATAGGAGSQSNRHDRSAVPHLGPVTAKHVIVEYFDYMCPACRKMGSYLDALQARHPGQIEILCLPVPMDAECNPQVPAGSNHPGACEVTRAALALWFARPEAFEAFHRTLLSAPSPERAQALAREAVGARDWPAALADPRIEALFRSDVAEWQALSSGTSVLPKLVIDHKRLVQGAPSNEEEFLRVLEAELGYAAGSPP